MPLTQNPYAMIPFYNGASYGLQIETKPCNPFKVAYLGTPVHETPKEDVKRNYPDSAWKVGLDCI